MTSLTQVGEVILVRHASVSEEFQGVCYGRSDVALSARGKEQSLELARTLSCLRPSAVFHSGVQRTVFLAERLSERLGISPVFSEALQERDFSTWELQPWDAIQRRSGDEMLRMVSEPETYRPGGGETTFELRDRVVCWIKSSVPRNTLVVAVTHGGPIAALLGTEKQLPVSDWVKLIPDCGAWVRISTKHSE
jgi:broad specificity phosphatase PhoE